MSSRNKKHSDNISPDKGRCISLCRYFMETGLPSPSHSVTLPGLRLPASASLPLASCWPRPQQLLPVSATGGGRRRCSQREGLRVGLIQLFQRFDHTLIFLLYRREQLVGTVKVAAAESFRQSTGRDVQCIEAKVLADALQGVSGTECLSLIHI